MRCWILDVTPIYILLYFSEYKAYTVNMSLQFSLQKKPQRLLKLFCLVAGIRRLADTAYSNCCPPSGGYEPVAIISRINSLPLAVFSCFSLFSASCLSLNSSVWTITHLLPCTVLFCSLS